MSTLAEFGIELRREQPGEHRTACPQCALSKLRKGDDALALRIEPGGSATWLCHRCGWKGFLPATGRLCRSPVRQYRRLRRLEPEHPSAGFSDYAADLWRSCRAIAADDPAGRYLLGRGCALPPPDGDVRWRPQLRHPDGHVGPAIIAMVTDTLSGRPLTLHRTWIAPDGNGKAAVDKPRLLLKGHDKAGGVIRIFPDQEVTAGLAIAEGLETALAAAVGFAPIWATIDAGNMEQFPVLAGVESLTILADHDEPNRQTGKRRGIEAARACAKRWLVAGAEVRVWRSPIQGEDFADFAAGVAA